MKFYLNLTPGFNPFGTTEESRLEFSRLTFSDGSPHIRIKSHFKNPVDVIVTMKVNSGDDLLFLAVATEALNQTGWVSQKALFLPYIIGMRQDRRAMYGEPLTIKVTAMIINDMQYDQVVTIDPHSDVTAALINNCIVKSHLGLVQSAILRIKEDVVLASPDAGAVKSLEAMNQILQLPMIQCGKHRDVETGKLSGFSVNAREEEVKDKSILIVDDIIDGGGTFIGLAQELKKMGAADIYLYATHGIFSKGVSALSKHFSYIYVSDSCARPHLDGVGVISIKFLDDSRV